jgi:DNA-binding MarR family transcriptional regulator
MQSSEVPTRDPVRRSPDPGELVAAERRLHRVLRNRLNAAVEGLGLSYAQVEILLLLDERPNMHASLIARELDSSRQAIHQLVRQLELGGLVDVLPADVGARPIALTVRGRRRLKMAWDAIESTAHAGFAGMSGEARRTVLESLTVCERALAPTRQRWWFD